MWIDGRSIDDIGVSCLFMSGRGENWQKRRWGVGKERKRWEVEGEIIDCSTATALVMQC